jgi:hypothetical protein
MLIRYSLLAGNGVSQIGDFGMITLLCVFETFLQLANNVVFGLQFGYAFLVLVFDVFDDCIEHVDVLLLWSALPNGLFLELFG